MTLRVLVFPEAEKDIDSYCEYLAENSTSAATRFLTALKKTFAQLARMPSMGAVRRFRHSRPQGIHWFPVSGFRHCFVF